MIPRMKATKSMRKTTQTRTRLYGAISAIAIVAALTSCTPPDAAEQDPAESEVGAEQIDPGTPFEEIELVTAGGIVQMTVYPLVQVEDHLVLTVDLLADTVAEGAQFGIQASRFDGDATVRGRVLAEEAGALRLVDPRAERIHLAATGDDAKPVGTAVQTSGFYIPESGTRVQRVFAAPETDEETLALLVPGGYIDGVPITRGDPPLPYLKDDEESAERYATYDPSAALDEIVEAPVLPLEGYTRQLDGAVEVIESTEKVEIRLSGDVLFAFNSFELGEGADVAIGAAADTLAAYDGGQIDVIGHTDDVGDDASNQVLSEQRANAVKDALAARVDASAFTLRAEGRGEREPLLENISDANRQANRRVTLTLTSDRTSQTEIDRSGQLPPFDSGPLRDGAEADGTTGFDRESSDGRVYRVSAPSAKRVDGLLVVTVEAERLDDEPAKDNEPRLRLGAGVWSFRGSGTGYSSDNAGFAPRILDGATAIYPLDYLLGDSAIDGDVEWRNASDTASDDYAPGGTTLRFVALYRDIPGAESITLDQPFVLGASPWRLTDIPIE